MTLEAVDSPSSLLEHRAPAGLCPACNSQLQPAQSWCLECGLATRTRLASTPAWQPIVLLLALVTLAAVGVLVWALATLAG